MKIHETQSMHIGPYFFFTFLVNDSLYFSFRSQYILSIFGGCGILPDFSTSCHSSRKEDTRSAGRFPRPQSGHCDSLTFRMSLQGWSTRRGSVPNSLDMPTRAYA